MIKIEKSEVFGFEHAIRGMRNPMNSWDKSDSGYKEVYGVGTEYVVGENDLDLMKRLVKAGTDHRKFMRMITVYVDITAPMYWWKEFDTYKVGTVRNSCSTMHKITSKKLTMEDFSHEHLTSISQNKLYNLIELLNDYIDIYNNGFESEGWRGWNIEKHEKEYLWQIIQLLPSSYNQKSTVSLNYEVLANMYKSRNNHKLDEWRTFCEFVETLPHSELITGKEAYESQNNN